jgi:hypothetical protein
MFKIIETERLSSTITRYVIEAPFIARKRKPGNFVIVRIVETGERIPLTIVDSDPNAGTITLIVQAIGKTTKLMAMKKARCCLCRRRSRDRGASSHSPRAESGGECRVFDPRRKIERPHHP